MHTMKPVNKFEVDLNSLVSSGHTEPKLLTTTVTYNPLIGVYSEEYSDSSMEQREIYLRNKCKEAEVVILTLSKMFEGEILELEIPEINLSVACILKTRKKLSSKEIGHIMSISPSLQIVS